MAECLGAQPARPSRSQATASRRCRLHRTLHALPQLHWLPRSLETLATLLFLFSFCDSLELFQAIVGPVLFLCLFAGSVCLCGWFLLLCFSPKKLVSFVQSVFLAQYLLREGQRLSSVCAHKSHLDSSTDL